MSEIKVENSLNSNILTKIEKYQNISLKLKDLKNLIKGEQKEDDNKTKIFEYVLYPDFINLNKIKDKIYELFNVKNNEELYVFLFEEINQLFEKDKSIRNSMEEISLRGHFYKILEYLNYFICYSVIYFPDNNENHNKAFECFNKWIVYDNAITKSILYSYINIFNLKDLLFDYYALKRDILLSISDCNRILFLISILNMENIFPFKYIIKIKNKNSSFIQKICAYELYRTYNNSLKEIYNLTDYLISLKVNWIEPTIIEKILNDKEIKDKLDNHIKIMLIENLMINYSLVKDNEKNKEKEFISYYRVLSKYINIISKNYFIDWSIINKIFKSYIDNKEYDKSINFINGIQDINIINKYINNKLIDTLISSIPLGKSLLISNLIKNNKGLINYLLNTNMTNNGIKLIKALQLNRNDYDEVFDEISMNNFFQYKISICIDNSFDILIDYSLINELSYNKVIYKLLKRYQNQNTSDNSNISKDKLISLKEEEDEENRHNINIFDFDNLNKFFLNENKKINEEKKSKIILNGIDKEKILTLIHFGKIKNYNISQNNEILLQKIFGDISLKNYILDYNKYIPEDKYEPHDSTCISINIKKQKIAFIDNVKSLNDNYNFFKKSKYIGIDSEWRQSFYANNKENASILQLSNYSERNIMIIDLLKMENDKEFADLFEKYFKDKTFIGYAFNNSDIDQFSERLQKMFKQCTIIDLIDIYQHKYLEKAPSLKELCLQFLGNKLCKYEQCSNWENRPLKKRQLHYAALDAIVCISLYKKLSDNE